MLQQLEIQNIALIEKVSLELGDGLNILTGETGAGKSIIIDSINAILGERLSKELIRTGTDKAVVEAVFQVKPDRIADLLETFGVEAEEDGTLIVSREFSLSGRNICRINGKMATVSMLKQLGEWLIDIHGQFDNQSLLRTDSHLELLDLFGGEHIQALKKDYSVILEEYKSLSNKLFSLDGNAGDREKRIDLLRFQIDEIQKAKLKPGEEEDLNKRRLLLSNAEKIAEALTEAYDTLYTGEEMGGSATDGINQAVGRLHTVSKLDEHFGELEKRLQDLAYHLDDIVQELRQERDGIEFDPDALEYIEERLDLIFKLKRKYGSSIEKIISYCAEIQKETEELENREEIILQLRQKLDKVQESLIRAAEVLHNERLKAAEILESRIGSVLEDLEMKKARFKASVEFNSGDSNSGQTRFATDGLDRVEFLISPNVGEPLKPLAKIASGGEMSRIMLAIKTILADVDHIPTLIFDEIDIGVSGKAAQKVGEKLSLVSRSHQVLCVTHLAQIACMADRHYLIEKLSGEEKTRTRVEKLSHKGRINEIARILGGVNISGITIRHAEEMLATADEIKHSL